MFKKYIILVVCMVIVMCATSIPQTVLALETGLADSSAEGTSPFVIAPNDTINETAPATGDVTNETLRMVGIIVAVVVAVVLVVLILLLTPKYN